MVDEKTLPERVSTSFQRLSAAAHQLNVVSDELGKSISALDLALKRLNLGVEAWETVWKSEDEQGNFWEREIGYAKVGSKWGIALRSGRGNYGYEDWNNEDWLFNDAPRALRIEAVEKLPQLLDRLIKVADETAAQLKDKIGHAQQVVAAINTASRPVPAQAKQVVAAVGTASRAVPAQRK